MEFLVQFDLTVPQGTSAQEVTDGARAEASAAGELADTGHLIRLWRLPGAPGESKAIGVYRADSEAQLDALLRALPLYQWLKITVTPLAPHPNDPVAQAAASAAATSRP